jgi:hypothetical protein
MNEWYRIQMAKKLAKRAIFWSYVSIGLAAISFLFALWVVLS